MSNANCWPRETLKQYLNGSTDDARLEAIEAHLADCELCEQTLLDLERDPDTLLVSVREQVQFGAVPPDSPSQENSAAGSTPSVVQRALDAIKRLPESTMASAGPLEKLKQIGAYQLIQPLGRGGMGLVMLARHVNLHKQVAIKLLPSLIGDRPELVQRFQREMRAAGPLNHPAIVNSTDAGVEQGTHYLVMEYIDGLDLSRLARLMGPLPIADACELIRQAALGLSYAHAEGIVHRDIKPSNLMLDRSGRVKILDFGLAQMSQWDEAACELTTVGQLMGTLDYMAPEQAERTGPVDYRADVYALGATLFRLLTGRAPLAAAPNLTLLEKVRLLASQTAPQVSTLRDDCPTELTKLIEQMLQRLPTARPASAAHVAEALQPWCAGHSLGKLLEQARQRAAMQPANDLKPSLNPQLAVPPVDPPRRHWWALAWLGPLAIAAAILIVLEMQKGQLVIESEAADIKVNVLRDGKRYEQLQVQTGAQSTRLFADKYAIEIEGASDGFTIDQTQVEIRRGATVVARIQQNAKPAIETQSLRSSADATLESANVPPQAPLESNGMQPLLYAGQSLGQWLDVMERDRDSKTRYSALPAIRKLASATDGATRDRINRALIAAIRSEAETSRWQIEGMRPRPSRNAEANLTTLVKTLIVVNGPSDALPILTNQFLLEDDQATLATLSILRSLLDLGQDPLCAIVNRRVGEWLLLDGRFLTLGEPTAWAAMTYFEDSLPMQDREFYRSLPARILSHPKLGLSALLMLQVPHEIADNADAIELEETIARSAREALQSDDSSAQQLALAAFRLTYTTANVESFRSELIPKLNDRLGALAADQERLFAVLPDVMGTTLPAFSTSANRWSSNSPRNKQNVQAELKAFNLVPTSNDPKRYWNDYSQSEVVSLLALATRLDAVRELDEGLAAIATHIFESALPLATEVQKMGELNIEGFEWPFDAVVLRRMPGPLAKYSSKHWRAVKLAATLNALLDHRSGRFNAKLSPLIMMHTTAELIAAADKNGDGQVSKAENPSWQSWGVDLDNNQVVTKDEMLQFQLTHLMREYIGHQVGNFEQFRTVGATLTRKQATPTIDDSLFTQMDANTDDKLTLKEIFDYTINHPFPAEPKSTSLNASSPDSDILDPALAWAQRQIAKYDKNKDGELTEDEWNAMIIKPRAGTDANNDGKITAEEFAKSRKP